MKDLYVKMTNTVDKIKQDLNKFIHMMYSWIKRLDIVKMSVSLKLVFRFKAIPVKISEFFLCVCVCIEIEKVILKCIRKCEGPRIAKIMGKNEQSWKTYTTWFKDLL